MKICTYSIAKNEIKNVEKFMKSLKDEADEIIVLDTGSTDGTPEKLKQLGAKVFHYEVNPWRYDDAFNIALGLVPLDTTFCMRVDLDEEVEPGWRKKIEDLYTPAVKSMNVYYVWSHRSDGSPDIVFPEFLRAHSPFEFKWIARTHEAMYYTGTDPHVMKNSKVVIHHWQDKTKTKPDDLPMLEADAAEDPSNPRVIYYLAREYCIRKKYPEAKKEFKHYLGLSQWASERCEAMRKLAYIAKKEDNHFEQFHWMMRAIAEVPSAREPWVELAQSYMDRKNYLGGYYAAKQALLITEPKGDFYTEGFAWGPLPYDIAGTCAYYIGLHEEFVDLTLKALQLDPNNERLRNNLQKYGRKS